MPSLNDSFIKNTFSGEVFRDNDTELSWNTVHREHPSGPMPTDHYTLRLDTFYTFDPSLSNASLSGRVYNESNYIASINEVPKVVSMEEGLAPIDIKEFPFSIEDDLSNEATGIEFIARSLADKSSVLDMRLVAEWWHWTVPGWNHESPLNGSEKNAFWQIAYKDITENLYLSKPIISFPEDTIRPMEIYSRAHLVSGSEDGSSVLNTHSGWDKVAGVWFDENINIQYSGKDAVIRTPSEKAESYSIYEVPDSGYQHYENEIYTKYKIVYSGDPSDKYKDEREVSFTKNDGVVASVERKITRASSTGDFSEDWEVLSENATSPFVDSEILTDYVSENIPVEEEDVYEVVSHGGQDYVEIDIIPNTGWGENPNPLLPYCIKEDELFFEEGCNLRMRQEGGWDKKRKSFFSEVMVYFQDTNSFPISGYKVEFQNAPPDESRIYQLQNVTGGLSDQDEVYFVGQAVGEGGSVGEAVYEPELFSAPQTDYEKDQGISTSSSASSRRSDSSLGFAMSQSIPRGELTVPRIVSEEEYSSHESGQKYIISPHGAYSEYRSAKSFSTAGVLYSNFGEISFQNDSKVPEHRPTVDTYALYEQKLNIENKVYSKNEKEIRIFESGACDGFSLIHHDLKDGEMDVFSPLDTDHAGWSIYIEEENGQELGIRDGIISCEPEKGEENYFFSSNGGAKDKFLGYKRLNYFLNKDYVTGVNGNVLQMVVYPDEKVELDLPKNLFEGDSVYYVERDIYVDGDVSSQANYIEPEISQQNKLSANIKNDTPYLTQTFHKITKSNGDWDIHNSSPLHKSANGEYFNLQLKTEERLDDTNSLEGCVDLEDPVGDKDDTDGKSPLVIPRTGRNQGWMLQRSEEKYFPSSAGDTASGTSMTFTGLTVGHYYELQKKINDSWQTDLKPTTNHPNNKPDEESEITLTVTVGETYRLKEWQKQFSYGELAVATTTKINVENVYDYKRKSFFKPRYRLVKLKYEFKNEARTCNWIINKNTFTNSNILHNKVLTWKNEKQKDENDEGFNSRIIGYWDIVDWLYDTSEIENDDEGLMKLRYKNFISNAAYTQPSNPHITRNMEGTPFTSLQNFKDLLTDELPQYKFNGVRLPYYLEAKAGEEENKTREKGGVPIVGKEYSYSDFSRLRVTRYVYRVYKKNAVLLGDLAKRDGLRDYGGWDFGLEKSVKANGVWGSWQSANILSQRKISSDYYAAAQLHIPYYSKGFGKVDSNTKGFDSGSILDAVMIETDETANYEPKDIRFRINKEQIVETDNECKVQSKYNFFPVNLSWDYLDGAVNLTEDSSGDPLKWTADTVESYHKITLADTDTYSYAIVKAAGEDVKLINSDNEIKIYRMREEKITATDQYPSPFECRVVGGEWNPNLGACQIKVLRKDNGSELKEGEPALIEGVTELRIISKTKVSGDVIATKIKKLPLSYTIKQKAKINGVEKTTYEQEVHGHNINSVRAGESGDEIYTLASDFECMNDSSALVSYEVFANIDDTSEEVGSAVVKQDDDFYNPPFQTSDFTVSGDNNIGGVFVCSGQSAMTVTANTDRTFHVVNVPGAPTVTVKNTGGTAISTLTAGKGVEITNKAAEGAVKDVTKLTQALSQDDAVLSDYSKIIGQSSFKLIEDENIYLENSDNDEQIVFDCLSKVNLPESPSAAFSFTGVNIATEPIPMVSPDNHLIDGELVHYMKPRSELRVNYANSAFSVETLELESQAAKLNIDQSKTTASQANKFEIKDGAGDVKGIYVTDKRSLEVIVPSLTDGFKHAFVIKQNSPTENIIVFKDDNGNEIEKHSGKYGVILKRVGGEYIFESITAPRPRLGKSTKQVGNIYSVEELANAVFHPEAEDWNENENYKNLKLNFLKLTLNTPEIVEYDVSTFVDSGLDFYIKNEAEEIKLIKFFNGNEQLNFSDNVENKRNTVPVGALSVAKVTFSEQEGNSFISYGQKKRVTKGDRYWKSNGESGVQMNKERCDGLAEYNPWGYQMPVDGTWEGEEEANGDESLVVGECTMSANKIEDEWLTDVEDGVLKFDDKTPVKKLLDVGNGSGRDYYFSTSKINGDRLVIPASAFLNGPSVEPIIKFSDADDFRVMVIPDSPFHQGMEGDTYWVNDDPFTKNEQYIFDYCNVSDDHKLKICTVPLFDSVGRDNWHDPKVLHKGREISHEYDQTANPYIDENTHFYRVYSDPDTQEEYANKSACEAHDGGKDCATWIGENEEDGECWLAGYLIQSSYTLSFKLSDEVITAEMLAGLSNAEGDEESWVDSDKDYAVTSGEKIVRVVDDSVKAVDLRGVTTPVILIIYEQPENESINIINDGSSNPTLMTGRSAMRAVYDSGSGSYTLTEVQFYEISYHNTDKSYRELNKFYNKSDYDNEVLLFNASVKIEGSSDAAKWIDRNKHMCTDESVLQITYAYSTNPPDGEYSILDSPLYINNLPSDGYVINKSNKEITMGSSTGVLAVEIYEGDVDDRGDDHVYTDVVLVHDDPGPSGAKATVTVEGGKVVKVEITAAGAGYEVEDWLSIAKGDIGDGEFDCDLQVTSLSTKTATLYSDEVLYGDTYLTSPNLRSEDYFIKLHNHTVTPRALYHRGQDEQREIVNSCRLNKLSPRALIYRLKNGVPYNIKNELENDWPDVEPYEYGITLYGNQLNSSKKINFEFYYDDLDNEEKVYNDLIYGKRIPSRALANTIGFSANTGNESIIKCIFFNERTGEVTFSGIKKDKEHVVIAVDHRSSTNAMDKIAYQEEYLEEVAPYVKYNGVKYSNGETFIGEEDVSAYSISSLDFANVKVSLLSDLTEEGDGGSKVDPVIHHEIETTTVGDEVVAEPAWRAMPDDDKTITVTLDDYEDGASYITGSIWNNATDESDIAVAGEVYSFSNNVNFTVDIVAGATLYGILIGGDLASGAIGKYNPSEEIKESNRWGTVIKSDEMLEGYRWSNFLVSHSFNHRKVRDLITKEHGDDGYSDRYYFITIKKQDGKTYSPQITDTTGLIKTAKDSDNLYVLRRAAKNDPPFNRHDKIEGITLSEPDLPDTIARVKVGKKDVFIPSNNYPVITTDNQAFKEDISISETRAAKESRRAAAAGLKTDLQTEITPKVMVVSAEEVLDSKNQYYEDVALNPTKNYANQVGLPGGITFYLKEENLTTDKLRVRLSRLVSKRIVLKDYSSTARIKSLEDNKIQHQLKYILEGELKSAYAYDEMVYKGTVKIGSVLFSTSSVVTIDTNTINAKGLHDGDAIVFSVWDGNTDIQTNKVYFIKSTGVINTYNLYRAEKLTADFKETFSVPAAADFRVVSRAIHSDKFTAKGELLDYIIVNKTCFRNRTHVGSTYIKLGLETYSFEHREIEPDGAQYPLSVSDIEDIFESRNNFAKNWYVLRRHKSDKKTVVFYLTKGRTYRYFIKSNVKEIVYGPDAENDKLESSALGTKGTFEAKQGQIEIVFNKDVKIGKTISEAEEGGPIGSIGNIKNKSSYKDGSFYNIEPTTSGSGTEAVVNVVVKDGVISRIDLINRGSGYEVDDILYIPKGDMDMEDASDDAECQVASLLRTSDVEDISSYICILEELKYEETDKELPCKPYSGGIFEVDDKGIHGIFKGKSRHTGTSGMDDVLLDYDNVPVLKTTLPAKISKIHPHVKLIKGGDNVRLSWTMGDKYWDGFWFNDKKYLPHSYKYEIFRTKREGEAEDKSIYSGTAETYSYPDVTADVNLYKTRIRTFNQETCEAAGGTWATSPDTCTIDGDSLDISGVEVTASAGNHTIGSHTEVVLIGGSKWDATSPRAIATVVIDDGTEVSEDAGKIKSITITNGGEGYAVGEKLTIPANRIGGADATCVVTNVEAIDLTNKNEPNRIKLDEQDGEVKYDRDFLRYTLKTNRNGTLEYIPGSNEKHLLYNKKRYYTAVNESIYIPYKKGGKIQIIGKDLEPFQRTIFEPKNEDYNKNLPDTFYVKVSEELFHIKGDSRNPDDEILKESTSDPMRLPLNWVSSFSESDIEDSQKFKDVKRDVDKVRLEVVANSANKGIELPELTLQVVTSRDEKGNAVRTPLPDWRTDSDYTEMIRNLFFKMTFTSAKVCIYDPIVEGRVSNVRLLNNGENYLSEPTVALDPPTAGYTINDGADNMIPFHRQSEAEAKLDAQGRISKIVVTDPGSGYGWKEGGYQYEKTDVKPIVYNLFKIKSGEVSESIDGAGTFLNEKFFSYSHQLANGTDRKVDPVSVVVTANPEDALSNTLSMGMTREEFSFVNNIFSKENSVQSENEELYTASEMSGESFIGGSPRSANSETPEGGHQDDINNLTEDPASHNFINVTPDEDGGQGQEEDADATLDTSPQGTSELDNRGADSTSSETTAKALGIVNDASLVDYRVKKRPYSKSSYPWISSMSSSTRPDYPMFFGTAPSTEISADAFNNMVDAANSLNKVNIDLPIYVRIKKHREETYRHVPDWGLRSKSTIDKFNNYFEDPDTRFTEYGVNDPADKRTCEDYGGTWEGGSGTSGESGGTCIGYEADVPVVLEEDGIICGTTDKDGGIINGGSLITGGYKAAVYHGIDLPFYELDLSTINQRRIATSITAGTLIGSFSDPPEIFIKEINSINALELSSECSHELVYGCYSKGDSVHQLFIKTTLIWCEYEILPFGTYAEAALGKDLLSNLDKSKTIYEGVFTSAEGSCSWGPLPVLNGTTSDRLGTDKLINVCQSGATLNVDWAFVDAGTVRSAPIETYSDEKNTPVIVQANGIIKIDPVAEVGGLINGIYGSVGTTARWKGLVSCFTMCAPTKEIWLTFPKGKNNGFMLNLDITKTDGADCF